MKLKEVLVVDDSATDLLYTRIIAQSAEISEKVLPFDTAIDALAYLQRPEGHAVDVILLDINMPEMDGFEFLDAYERLHAGQQARAVVIMLTSSPDQTDRTRALAHPCVKDYLIKPINRHSARALADRMLHAAGLPAAG